MSTRLVGLQLVRVVVVLTQAACAAHAPSGPHDSGSSAPTHYAQSMNSAVDGCLRNPACVAASPGDEALIPWLSRAAQATRAAIALKEFLDEAEVRLVERILIECAKEADATINEREYGPGKHPSDAECSRVVGYTWEGEKIIRAMELGTMKHAEAFACVQRRLLTKFPDHISVEPQYGADSVTGRYVLTNRRTDSLRPDIVLHAARNPNKVRCVYDFKFPCTLANKREPLSMKGVEKQLLQYDALGGNCPSAIVTPQLGINP